MLGLVRTPRGNERLGPGGAHNTKNLYAKAKGV